MRLTWKRRLALAALAVGWSGLAACGLTISGAGSSSTSTADAEGDSEPAEAGPVEPAVECNASGDAGRFLCVADDWALVLVAASGDAGLTASACPTGYALQRLFVNPRSSGSACACQCGDPVTPPCATGTLSTTHREQGGSSCNDGTAQLPIDGACRAIPFTWSNSYDDGVVATPLAVKSVACAATATKPRIDRAATLSACVAAADAGLGGTERCSGGSCQRRPPSRLEACLVRAGDHACPDPSSDKRLIVLEPTIKDERTCAACACTSKATSCSGASLAFYSDAQCTQSARTVAINGGCNTLSGDGARTHYRYTATPNDPACAAASASVAMTGDLVLAPQTLCCPR